jgi:hypothetical protein
MLGFAGIISQIPSEVYLTPCQESCPVIIRLHNSLYEKGMPSTYIYMVQNNKNESSVVNRKNVNLPLDTFTLIITILNMMSQ